MRKKIVTSLALAIIIITLSVNLHSNTVMASSDDIMANTIAGKLKNKGYKNIDVKIKDNQIVATIYSDGTKQSGANEILAIRAVRNEARAYVEKDKSKSNLKGIREVEVNQQGEVTSDIENGNLFVIPTNIVNMGLFTSNTNINENDVKKMIDDAFKDENIDIVVYSISKSPIIGNCVELELKNHKDDLDFINEQVAKSETLFEALNEKGAKIAEYTLTAKSEKNNETVFLLSADLIYRDFIWWNSIDLGIGSWISQPQMKPDSEQKGTNSNSTIDAKE